MARPRGFDFEHALDQAMQVFRAKGYEGTSMEDLVGAMGIKKGSLYKAYGDKRRLYRAALARYHRTVLADLLRPFDDGSDGRVAIGELLQNVVDAGAVHADRYGCFLCNAAVDQAPFDDLVEEQVLHSLDRLTEAVTRALRTCAWPSGDREETLWPYARTVTAVYLGLWVLAKAGAKPAELQAVRDTLLQTMVPPVQ